MTEQILEAHGEGFDPVLAGEVLEHIRIWLEQKRKAQAAAQVPHLDINERKAPLALQYGARLVAGECAEGLE